MPDLKKKDFHEELVCDLLQQISFVEVQTEHQVHKQPFHNPINKNIHSFTPHINIELQIILTFGQAGQTFPLSRVSDKKDKCRIS